MREKDRRKYIAYSKLPRFKKRLKEAREISQKAMDIGPFYCAFSGGKDSTVVAHISGFDKWHWHDEIYLPETNAYLERSDCNMLAQESYHSEEFTAWKDCRPDKESNIEFLEGKNDPDKVFREKGYVGVVLGLRCEENRRRRFLLGKHGPLFKKKNGFWYCNPIWNWSSLDVWAYIATTGIDYNKDYDKLLSLLQDEKHCRIGPILQERVLSMGQMAILRAGWPEFVNNLKERFPNVSNYI